MKFGQRPKQKKLLKHNVAERKINDGYDKPICRMNNDFETYKIFGNMSVNYTLCDCKWIPRSAKFVTLGSHPREIFGNTPFLHYQLCGPVAYLNLVFFVSGVFGLDLDLDQPINMI